MSILPLFLVVGVAISWHIGGHGNSAILQPIILKSQANRICAELCSAGLGGESCGETCMDIAPQDLPIQSQNGTRNTSNESRRDVCPMLCANSLGRPLCDCEPETNNKSEEIDFVQICGTFCTKYGYRINGCQSCDVYNKASHMFELNTFSRRKMAKIRIDWNEWCKQKCLEGDGGVACNCDILPISINL